MGDGEAVGLRAEEFKGLGGFIGLSQLRSLLDEVQFYLAFSVGEDALVEDL